MQERVDSGLTDKFIVHKPVERFIINTHAFHNAHLLRQALPRRLTEPIPLFADRKAKHYELAASLREIKTTKRKHAAEKRAAKKAQGTSANAEREDSADDSEEEQPPRKKQRRTRRQADDDEDSDSEYDGGSRVEVAKAGAARTSGRVRRSTKRAQGVDAASDSE